MMNTIEAVYEGGVFRPLIPPDIIEGQRVRIVVEAHVLMWRGSPDFCNITGLNNKGIFINLNFKPKTEVYDE